MPLLSPRVDFSLHLLNENYDADLWENAYIHFERYLIDISDSDLDKRYKAILRNQTTLITPERDKYPYHNVWLSSWFWFRKQIETETEYKLRNKAIPDVDLGIDPMLFRVVPPIKSRHLNSADYSVKFGELSWLKDRLAFGKVRVKHASVYLGDGMNLAQKDDELRSYCYSPGHAVRITDERNRVFSPIGKVTYTKYLEADCYILCTSNEFDPILFHDFSGYDGCLLIRNVDEFARRLESAWKRMHGEWFFTHNNIEYFDEYNRNPMVLKNDTPLTNQQVGPVSSKSFTFAYQKEYRFWWANTHKESCIGKALGEYTELTLGDLSDIAEIYSLAELLKKSA
jgi:hypothetical protein